MLALWLCVPHNELAIIHVLSLPGMLSNFFLAVLAALLTFLTAKYHQISGIYGSQSTAADHPPLCFRFYDHIGRGHPLREAEQARYLRGRLGCFWCHRLYHPARKQGPRGPTWYSLPWDVLCGRWDLPSYRPGFVLAGDQRVWSDQASHCECHADLDWELRCSAGYTAVSCQRRAAVHCRAQLCTGIPLGKRGSVRCLVLDIEEGEYEEGSDC